MSNSPPATGSLGNSANPLVTFGSGSSAPGASSTQIPNDVAASPNAFGLTQQDLTATVPYQRVPDLPNGMAGPTLKTKLRSQPLANYMTAMEKLDPQDMEQLQQQLYSAGYYDNTYYSSSTNLVAVTGVPDDAFKSALKKAAQDASASGGRYTVGEIIAQRTQAIQAAGANAAQKPIKFTNPQDVAANAEQAGFKVVGRALPPATIAAIQAKAESAAEQQYTNSDGLSAATAFSPSEAWLEQQVQQLMPQASGNYSVFNNFQAASQLFGNSTSPIGNLYHQ